MIDNHPTEKEAIKCFAEGDNKKGHALQDAFVKEVRESGEDHCSCKQNCKYHGNCVDCVIIHRGHGDHLPACFWNMMNERIEGISALTEHSIKQQK